MISRRPSWLAVAAFVVLTALIRCQDQSPKEKSAKEGDSVYLECRGGTTTGCIWTPSGGPVVTTFDPNLPSRFTFNPDYTNGDCSLTITSVMLNDAGKWMCQLYDKDRTSVQWLLTVGSIPKDPVIYYNEETEAGLIHDNVPKEVPIGDDIAKLYCIVENAVPDTNRMQWSVSAKGSYSENKTYDSEARKAVNVLTLSEISKDKEVDATCTVEHENYGGEKIKKVTAIIGRPYATDDVKISQIDTNHAMCKGNGIPRPTAYEWEFVLNKNDVNWEPVAYTANITLDKTGEYRCKAKNSENPDWMASTETLSYESNGGISVHENTESSNTQQAGMIVGIVIAALVVICIIAGLTLFTFRRKVLCFQERSHRPGVPENVENGGKIQTINSPDGKPDVKGDQNENTKQKEIVYAQLNLPQSQGNHSPKSPKEKTEYAQIKFQPKENQV